MSAEMEERREAGKEWIRGRVKEFAGELGAQIVELYWKPEDIKKDHQTLVIQLGNKKKEKRFENIDLEDYLNQPHPLEYELKGLLKNRV